MAKKNTHYRFRLLGDKRPKSWQLGLKATMIKKVVDGKNHGLKKVAYVPGSDSIFIEDHKGDEQSQAIWFEDGVLDVHKDNKVLVDIVFGHRAYNKRYELVDENKAAVKKLSKYDLIEKANTKINVANEDELRATALVVLGGGVIEWEPERIKAGLKERAYETPQDVLDQMNSGDYHGKYIAALALLKGVVLINPSRTGVTWVDGKTIVQVPAGQDPLAKLGQFLSGKDEQAVITLQELGERIKRSYTKKTDPDVDEAVNEILGDDAPPPAEAPVDESKEALENAKNTYKDLYEKNVPNNKKNDLDWILGKIDAFKA